MKADPKQPDLFGNDEARQRLALELKASRREAPAFKAGRTQRGKPKRRGPTGRELAAEGMATVAANAEDNSPGWGGRAFEALRRHALVSDLFTGEQVKRRAYAQGLDRPHNESAWGPVMNRGKREKIIERAGFAPPSSASRHCAPNRQWRSLIRGGE